MALSLNNYQLAATETAIYPEQGSVMGLAYTALGLTGEAGEIANKVKKILRDDDGVLSIERREEIAAELGDVLWYVAQVATELDISLAVIAKANLQKLLQRKAHNTIMGSGDTR